MEIQTRKVFTERRGKSRRKWSIETEAPRIRCSSILPRSAASFRFSSPLSCCLLSLLVSIRKFHYRPHGNIFHGIGRGCNYVSFVKTFKFSIFTTLILSVPMWIVRRKFEASSMGKLNFRFSSWIAAIFVYTPSKRFAWKVCKLVVINPFNLNGSTYLTKF